MVYDPNSDIQIKTPGQGESNPNDNQAANNSGNSSNAGTNGQTFVAQPGSQNQAGSGQTPVAQSNTPIQPTTTAPAVAANQPVQPAPAVPTTEAQTNPPVQPAMTQAAPVAPTNPPIQQTAAPAPPASQPVQQTTATTVQPQGATTNDTSSNSSTTNRRAFKLDEGVEEAKTGVQKPEKFAVPKVVKEKYPDLVELIKVTESMDDQERQYWFHILPIMTKDQVEKFKTILLTEKEQLEALDKEYEDELNRLNEKHLLEWKEFESKEKTRVIKENEAKSEEQEKVIEEDLLAKLSDV